jgi:hypothetical protein
MYVKFTGFLEILSWKVYKNEIQCSSLQVSICLLSKIYKSVYFRLIINRECHCTEYDSFTIYYIISKLGNCKSVFSRVLFTLGKVPRKYFVLHIFLTLQTALL